MKDIDMKATCPYIADVKCDAAKNALCDNKCVYHPRYINDGLNENYKTHRCPYSENTTCSGETCGADCCFHPEYDEESSTDFRNDWGEYDDGIKRAIKKIDRPDLDFDMNEDADMVSDYEDGLPVRNLTEEEYIDLKKKFKAFDDGFEMGIDFALEKESAKKCSLLKDKSNWHNGLAPCVGCERECPITAGMVEEKEPELTYDDGVVDGMNKLQEWYNEGRRVGYDKGVAEGYEKGQEDMMIECSGAAEDNYLCGYKDGFYGEPPMVEDDELREVMSEQPTTSSNYMENAGVETLYDDFCVSGKILCMVENAKKSLAEIRREIYTSSINYDEKRLIAFKILKIVDMLDSVQHQYTSDEMYRFLGYME